MYKEDCRYILVLAQANVLTHAYTKCTSPVECVTVPFNIKYLPASSADTVPHLIVIDMRLNEI